MDYSQPPVTRGKSDKSVALAADRSTVYATARQAVSLGWMTPQERDLIELLTAGSSRCAKTGNLVCTQAVQLIATLGSRHRSTVSKQVKSLVDKGWLLYRCAANGARGNSFGYAVGLDLSPLLSLSTEVGAARKEQLEAALQVEGFRLELKTLKGELRHILCRLEDQPARLADFIASIPRRYGKLSASMLRQLVETARELVVHYRALMCGNANSPHGRRTITEPTNTNPEEERICRSAGEKAQAANVAPEQAETAFDIDLTDALDLVEPALRTDIIQTYKHDPRQIWAELFQIASWRWASKGGGTNIPDELAAKIGKNQASVLLMLAIIRADRGEVRSLPGYALGCARKVVLGTFMWGAGVRAGAAAIRRDHSMA